MPLYAVEALFVPLTIVVLAVLVPGAATLTARNDTNQNENGLPPVALPSRAKRTVGCSDDPSTDGNLCYNAQCPFFSMGACKDGLCACAPKGKNMAAIREVCYDSCYASCTQSCFMDHSMRASLKMPCDIRCTKLCHED